MAARVIIEVEDDVATQLEILKDTDQEEFTETLIGIIEEGAEVTIN